MKQNATSKKHFWTKKHDNERLVSWITAINEVGTSKRNQHSYNTMSNKRLPFYILNTLLRSHTNSPLFELCVHAFDMWLKVYQFGSIRLWLLTSYRVLDSRTSVWAICSKLLDLLVCSLPFCFQLRMGIYGSNRRGAPMKGTSRCRSTELRDRRRRLQCLLLRKEIPHMHRCQIPCKHQNPQALRASFSTPS